MLLPFYSIKAEKGPLVSCKRQERRGRASKRRDFYPTQSPLSFCQAVSDLLRFLDARSGCLTTWNTGALLVSLKGRASLSKTYLRIRAGRACPDKEGALERLASLILGLPESSRNQSLLLRRQVWSAVRPGEQSGLSDSAPQGHRLTRLEKLGCP